MSRLLPVRFSIACLVLSLGACSSSPERSQSWLGTADLVSATGAANETARASVGSFLQLPASSSQGSSKVRVVHEYRAASGRLCRQVQLQEQENTLRVMCDRGKGEWSLTRSLVGPEDSASLAAMESERRKAGIWGTVNTAVRVSGESSSLPSLPSVPSVQQEVGEGESLWRFAARTTGNPVNWKKIAEFNDIDDPDRVRAGTELNVPAHLFSGPR